MKGKQVSFNLNQGRHGGRREGAGRKRTRSEGVAHRCRRKVTLRTPLHVNFKLKSSLRNKSCLKLLKRAIQNARSHGLLINHFSLQSNHVHLIIEASNNEILTRGMRSLTITLAKGIRRGRVQIERYHLHVLRSIREVKHAVHYVLFNQQKHEKGIYQSQIDGYSSLLTMNGALDLVRRYAAKEKIWLVVKKDETWAADAAQSFLLKAGIGQLFH